MTPNDDETILTAYALGELAGADRAEAQARIARDPAAREAADDIRRVARALASHFDAELMPALPAERRREIEAFVAGRGRPTRRAARPATRWGSGSALDPTARSKLHIWRPFAVAASVLILCRVGLGLHEMGLLGAPAAPSAEPLSLRWAVRHSGRTLCRYSAGMLQRDLARLQELLGVVVRVRDEEARRYAARAQAAPPPLATQAERAGLELAVADLDDLGGLYAAARLMETALYDAYEALRALKLAGLKGAPFEEARRAVFVKRPIHSEVDADLLGGAVYRIRDYERLAYEIDAIGGEIRLMLLSAERMRQIADAAMAPSVGATIVFPSGGAFYRRGSAGTWGSPVGPPPLDGDVRPAAIPAGRPLPTGGEGDEGDPGDEGPFRRADAGQASSFPLRVPCDAYADVRRAIDNGALPPRAAVRVAEMVNYFAYGDAHPDGEAPLAVDVAIAGCPWNGRHRLARVAARARPRDAKRAPCNLVFLLDVSVSMRSDSKLARLRDAMKLLVRHLDGRDRLAIVAYAGPRGLVLDSTPGDRKQRILAALGRLHAGGAIDRGSGIALAYDVAAANLLAGAVNRVVLCTDGDLGLGVDTRDRLMKLARQRADAGVTLSVLGLGMGGYRDARLAELADSGRGPHAYADTLDEASTALLRQTVGGPAAAATDARIAVQFDPDLVAAYRLIGYEGAARSRGADRAEKGATVHAGDHATALYEIVPAERGTPTAGPAELMKVLLRYAAPADGRSEQVTAVGIDRGTALSDAPADFRFAAAVAAFGMFLRSPPRTGGDGTIESILALARPAVGADLDGSRAEFIRLVEAAGRLLPAR